MYQVKRIFHTPKHMPWVTHFLLSVPPEVYEPQRDIDACRKNLDKIYRIYQSSIVRWHRGRVSLRSFTNVLRKQDTLIIQSKKGNSFFEFKIYDNEKSISKQSGCVEK